MSASNPAPNKKPQPLPRNQHIFDPWNTSSSGHQRAENPYSRTTEWRDTRREKLARQFRSDRSAAGDGGGGGGGGGGGLAGGSYTNVEEDGQRVSDEEKGEWRWMCAQEATRNDLGVADIRRYMGCVSKAQPPSSLSSSKLDSKAQSEPQRQPTRNEKLAFEPADLQTEIQKPNSLTIETSRRHDRHGKGIFTSLTFYINGSTYPTISDHKLKRLLADEGGNISLYLARKSITHVILGAATGAGAAGSSGARKTGGLLSAGKMQKEVLSKRSGFGKGVKYVNVEWVIESIKAGKKLPEARFSPSLHALSSSSSIKNQYKTCHTGVAVGVPVGQKSVYNMFNKPASTGIQ